ncbi:MAG: flagellar type III secretion system pore protein FliP [Acidimicrobiales bacterium]|nr:flagellar type III secretion system pore protein FliP [Acidimicrobiales bacterium]
MVSTTDHPSEIPSAAERRATTGRRVALIAVRALVFVAVFVATIAFTSGVAAQEVEPGTAPDSTVVNPPLPDEQPVPNTEPVEPVVRAQPTGPDGESSIQPTQPTEPTEPDVAITIDTQSTGLTQTVVIILLLTIGSIAPSILLLATSFTRFAIVLSLTRNALGTQSVPPTQVLIGLALILTFFVMAPTFSEVNDAAIQPLLNGEIEQGEAFEAGYAPMRDFMLKQTSEDDLRLFLDIRNEELENIEDVSASVLIPAFVLSELRTAFTIGFVIFIPFLVIDIVISSVLMSLGMVMLPPVFVSLPVKLLMFVLVDGWGLIVVSLVSSVNTT